MGIEPTAGRLSDPPTDLKSVEPTMGSAIPAKMFLNSYFFRHYRNQSLIIFHLSLYYIEVKL